jgi:molybdopterin molybdotransferase
MDQSRRLNEFDDVRMRGFAHRVTVAAAWEWLDGRLATLAPEVISLADAAGRVLAADVVSQFDVPMFSRSMMDGFAIRAEDSSGAGPYNRLPFTVVGQVLPGEVTATRLHAGQAMRIMTGAPLPPGADAVLPAEKVELRNDCILAVDEVSPGKNVGQRGEDIAAGTVVLRAGRILRPQDLGVLSSIGAAEVAVVRKPRVRLVVTGNELLPSGSRPQGNCIVDANSPMLTALVQRDGGVAIHPGIVRDEPGAILEALQTPADVVVVSGGSSVGQEDYAPQLVAQHGELAVHGIAMRPSSPTGMGTIGGNLVFLLPGNPVSCLCAFDFFAGRAIRALAGKSKNWPYRQVELPLRRKLVSAVGRLDYSRVRIVEGAVEPLAIAGASILSSTTRADGFVIVHDDSEGYPAGAMVSVFLYDVV